PTARRLVTGKEEFIIVGKRQIMDLLTSVRPKVIQIRLPRAKHGIVPWQGAKEPPRLLGRIPRVIGEVVQPQNSESADLRKTLRIHGREAGGQHHPRGMFPASLNHGRAESPQERGPVPTESPVDPGDERWTGMRLESIAEMRPEPEPGRSPVEACADIGS